MKKAPPQKMTHMEYEAHTYTDRHGREVFHNDNGPAYISDTNVSWYLHGERHRLDGPAMYIGDKDMATKLGVRYEEKWYVNGFPIHASTLIDMGIDVDNFTDDDKILLALKYGIPSSKKPET